MLQSEFNSISSTPFSLLRAEEDEPDEVLKQRTGVIAAALKSLNSLSKLHD